MVDRYLEQQPAIQAPLLMKDFRKTGDTHLPTSLNEVDMSIAEDIVQVMKPMKTATTVMCDEQQPTLSVVYPLYSSLLKSTAPANCDDTDSRTIREMKRAMHEDLNHRYQSDVDVSLLHNAAAMDPRFKDLPFLSDVQRMTVFSKIAVEASHLVNIAACEVTVKQETDDKTAAVPALPLLPDLPPVESPQPESPTQTDSDTSPPRAKEKSKMDWNTFKKDKGIEDDLQIHNRGKESYLERMAFLNRADVRQFEIEKSLRLSKSKR
ncbi:E3 SUMO-protein ligase ZBED1-like isoform X3 [Haliotis rubra]|uniref:E3 SUMO-protein ligase ZBED1-like isoform X3 n=1 Tax=Haliotis rubra TaxID=36100 RepID=UPI001EE59069|nr:E3 SUMO-protein ligase ZBED1-like isoform X3 [Haliotis rubra]